MSAASYADNIRKHTDELKRRNRRATEKARADLPALVAAIRHHPKVRCAYLFGSLAKDMFHPRADIDIAVEGLIFDDLVELQLELQKLTEFIVDLRPLPADGAFRDLIEFYGELLHADK